MKQVVLILIGVIALGVVIYPFAQDYVSQQRFAGSLDRFLEIKSLRSLRGGAAPKTKEDNLRAARGEPGQGHRCGKVVLIDRDAKALATAFFKLSAKVRALDPDEVRTVVWMEYHQSVAGEYVNTEGKTSGKAYTPICLLTVIDLDKKKIVGYRKLYGEAQPIKFGEGDRAGFKPFDFEIVRFVENLSLRQK